MKQLSHDNLHTFATTI